MENCISRENGSEVGGNRKRKCTHYILTLTRSCTQNCDFCAVDALYSPTVAGCAERARQEQLAGRELSSDQWCAVVEKLLSIDPYAKFDLSGGDCLALPWVSQKLIPFILDRVRSRTQLSVTSTAEALHGWLANIGDIRLGARPGAVHVTYDGYRQYSFDNIHLASRIRELEMDFHVECPLTEGNCDLDKVRDIYSAMKDAHVSEVLLMRFFPVGRGADEYRLSGIEPSPEKYLAAIAEFCRLAAKFPEGPTIKVQCGLKNIELDRIRAVPCKMGESTWCIMPNGDLLVCPWAYGMNGRPLDSGFVAGNVLNNDLDECRSRARGLRNVLRNKYPKACRVHAFVEGTQRMEQKVG